MVGSLGTAQPSKAGGDSPRGFKTGKYNCFVYMNSLPVLAEALTFNPGGTYATRGGGAKTGRYSFDSKLADSKSAKINLSGGPMDGAVIAPRSQGRNPGPSPGESWVHQSEVGQHVLFSGSQVIAG